MVETKSGLSKKDYIQVGKVIELVSNQRVPLVISSTKDVLVFVPPRGTRFGDSVMGNPDVEMEFFSPLGKSKGKARWFVFDGDPDILRDEIQKALVVNFPDLKQTRSSLYIQIPHPIFNG